MDSFENIILFIFILFSIISSIMKKKKQADAKAGKNSPRAAKKTNPSIIDMFQELTKAALTEKETESEVDAYFLETQKETAKLSKIDKAEELQRNSADKSFSTFQKPTLMETKETRFDLMYDKEENKLNLKNQNLHKFRKLLNNPKSLREYVLMKEILDKPKALQEL